MSLPIPNPRTLREAVQEVIRQNSEIGYPPVRFRQATENGKAYNLLAVCTGLIQKPETLDALQKAVESHPSLLTLEDIIAHSPHGSEWGFSAEVVELATARSEGLDGLVGSQRWI